jgi:hypothetical protein
MIGGADREEGRLLMAVFSRHSVADGTPGQTVWKKIRDLLTTNESVEVVVVKKGDKETFELRAWTSARADGSNGPEAVPGKNY